MSAAHEQGAGTVTFAPDINPLLAEAFLEEAPAHAARFCEAVGRLTGARPSLEDVVAAQHVAHSLKGSANITGVTAIADLTHVAEDVLDWLADNDALPPAGLRDALVETADCLAAMVDALRDGSEAPAGSGALTRRLRECREGLDGDGAETGTQAAEPPPETGVEAGVETAADSAPQSGETRTTSEGAGTRAAREDDAVSVRDGEPTDAGARGADADPQPVGPARETDACSATAAPMTVAMATAMDEGAVAQEPSGSSQPPDETPGAAPGGAPAADSIVAAPLADAAPGATPPPTSAAGTVDAMSGATAASAPIASAAGTPPDGTSPAPAAAAPSAASAGRVREGSLRVPVDLVDRLLRLAGEFAVSNVQSQGAHQRMTAQANSLREQYHLVQQRLSDLQDLVEVRGVPSGQRNTGRPRPGERTATGTLVEGFDPLELDEYNELHSTTTALAEAMTDFCEVALGLRPELARLDDTIVDQQRISKELSDAVMSARMVPVGSVEARLQRTVRETCRATGKQASLEVNGGQLPVDGDVLGALVDPLLHVLRNAVDHGIESPEEREAAGKPASGALRVDFSREGDNVLVEIVDDGRGFDVDRIREVAEARGLIASQETRTERELLQLAVLSGFSTRTNTTQISGRGIGMDVVHRAVLDLKGSLDIASSPGGATVSLRVPLTLISMHVLLVRTGGRVFGVPSGTLEQVLFSDAGTVEETGDGPVFTHEEREYRVRHLATLTGRGQDAAAPGGRALPMLLLEADAGRTAVVVDAAVDGRYLVVKSLGERVPHPAGVIGASILGDGSVAPVLDLRELLRHRAAATAAELMADGREDVPEETEAPEVLVVEDSLTARRMLSIALTDAGYRVRTAIDGLDAVEAIEESLPHLVVTDLEMPRMNGLELTAHLRGEDHTAELPVLMVTSRSTEKHRGQAETAGISGFVTKPYSNEELIERVRELLETVAA